MTKRHINIDDQLLEEAKVLLGTKTITQTVQEALKVVIGIPMVDFEIEWWKTHSLADLP